MTPASERLVTFLRPLLLSQGGELDAAAGLADVSVKIARIAARGRAVSVAHHLRLSAAVGHDPYIDGRTFEPFALGRFSRAEFAATVRRYRKGDRHLDIRAGAKAIGISVRALSFLENERPVCIDTALLACQFVGIHPFAFAAVHVKPWCNPLSNQVAA